MGTLTGTGHRTILGTSKMATKTVSSLLSLASLLFVVCSLFLFIVKNIVTGGWTASDANITPLRWISSTVVPVIVVSWGHGKKRSFEADYKEGGQRNWLQVLCNGGMATELSL